MYPEFPLFPKNSKRGSTVYAGSPILRISFHTRDQVYELNSRIGDPNSDILSLTTDKSLESPAGSWRAELVTNRDADGKMWSDKLGVFDYTEIFIRGINDDEEKIVMRGLIDNISFEEDYTDGNPRRKIMISGRDLGSLLTDFQLQFIPELNPPEVAILKIFAVGEILQSPNAQKVFSFLYNRFQNAVDLVIGKTYKGNTIQVSLSDYLQPHAEAFYPEMIANIFTLSQYEGPFWNAFQKYQDKPWHELFVWEDKDTARLVLRPARLKDMKGIYHWRVEQLRTDSAPIQSKASTLYPPDFQFWDVDKISVAVRKLVSQTYNYFFTEPCVPEAKENYRQVSLGAGDALDKPWKSVNPFFSIRDSSTNYDEASQNQLIADEPLSYIGRYGLRGLILSTNYIWIDAGQTKTGAKQDSSDIAAVAGQGEGGWAPSTATPPKGASVVKQVIPAQLAKWESLVDPACTKYGVQKSLVYAVMQVGSVGYPNARDGNRSGLMMLNPILGTAPNNDPYFQVEGSCAELASLNKTYSKSASDSDRKMIAAYFSSSSYDVNVLVDTYGDVLSGDNWFNHLPYSIQSKVNDVLAYRKQFVGGMSAKTSEAKLNAETQLAASTATKTQEVSFSAQVVDQYYQWGVKLNRILVTWFLHNPYLYSGNIVLGGTNQAIIGTYALDMDDGMEYYTEGVSHEFVVFGSYKTTLTVSRGQNKNGGLYAQGLRGPFYFGDKDPEPEAVSTSGLAKIPISGQPDPAEKKLPETGFVRLPDGVGYKYVGDEYFRYDTPETVKKIQEIGKQWEASHPGTVLGINDLCRQDGGPAYTNGKTPPHKAHRSGREADIRPVRKDRSGGACTIGDTNYSQPWTRDLVSMITSVGCQSILFNDSTVGAVTYCENHNNHLHVNFT